MKKDPHPMSLKSAETISSVIILLAVGGPGVFLILQSAENSWNLFELFGGIVLIGTSLALIGLIWRSK
jgi:hypothetical protein